ncbi:MAG: hypothetical protein ACYS8Z_15335 [Planctomycetota bacterium]|jgi:hypothetical protein
MKNSNYGVGGRMIEANSNHFKVVADSLTGIRDADEQTFASLAVLRERFPVWNSRLTPTNCRTTVLRWP